MWIDRSLFQENNQHDDSIVNGHIEINGQFSREEWEKIKTGFIAMGLMQRGGHRPVRQFPSRLEFIEAVQAVAGGRNEDAVKQLYDKYQIPYTKQLTLGDCS